MTMSNEKKTDTSNTEQKSQTWIEKNGPLLYGVGVFAALAALIAVHMLLSS